MALPLDLQAKYGRDELYREWSDKIPLVRFNPEWDVRAIPPFGGALIRYRVQYEGASVSIYLDGDNSLGYGPEPAYWEIYPYDDDVWRCRIDETNDLVEAISQSIRFQNNHPLSGLT